ncbi:hypothetical protein DXC21_02360 [Coprobacillus sp. OM08-19]|nr:hypothetical protein DXC21_02360 [Coprobacillus sp. OM08-19]
MEKLIEKITLYDFVAMIIPGLLVSLSVISFVPKEFYEFYKDIGNDFVAGALLLIISYCIGWIISEIAHFHVKHSIIDKIINFIKESAVETNEIPQKLKEEYKKSLEIYLGKSIEMDEIKKYGEMAYALIQTDSKYSRIHNYNSSKSFSKNLSLICLFLSVVLLVHAKLIMDITYSIICIVGAIFFIIGCFELKNRYESFKYKVNYYIYVYFIDFVKEHSKEENKDVGSSYIKKYVIKVNGLQNQGRKR